MIIIGYHFSVCIDFPVNAEDGKLMADSETGEFWGFFGGFAPLPKRTANDEDKTVDSHSTKLLR